MSRSDRLHAALVAQALTLPGTGRVAVLRAEPSRFLDEIPRDQLRCEQSFRPLHDALDAAGHDVAPTLEITDAALVSVGTLQSLEYLNLYGTEVTDDGLTRLRSLKSLQSLYVWDTGVTADGVLAFKAALPDVEVVGVELPPEPRRPLVAPKPDPTPAADD